MSSPTTGNILILAYYWDAENSKLKSARLAEKARGKDEQKR